MMVRERRNGGSRKYKVLAGCVYIKYHVLLAEHYALTLTGGSGGEKDGSQLVWIDLIIHEA